MRGGCLERVKQLLESAEVNERDSTGRTPLMFAAQNGRLEAAEGHSRAILDVQWRSWPEEMRYHEPRSRSTAVSEVFGPQKA